MPSRVDDVWSRSSDEEALEMTAAAGARGGHLRGHVHRRERGGARRLAERLGPDAVMVTLAADSGFKYMSVAPLRDVVGPKTRDPPEARPRGAGR